MHTWCRSRFALTWGVSTILLAVAAVVACASHPPVHDRELPHPPLCFEANSPTMPGHHKTILFADDGSLPLLPTFLAPLVPLTSMHALVSLALTMLPHPLSAIFAHTSMSTPRAFLPILRL